MDIPLRYIAGMNLEVKFNLGDGDTGKNLRCICEGGWFEMRWNCNGFHKRTTPGNNIKIDLVDLLFKKNL